MSTVPIEPNDWRALVRRIWGLWWIYLKSQVLAGVAVGVIIWLLLTILGVRYAPWLGVLAGILELLPQVGWLISLVPAVIVALLEGSSSLPLAPWVLALVVVGVYALVQLLQNLVIQPRIVGKGLDLPWYVVLVTVLLGGILGGLLIPAVGSALGAILAVPVLVAVREVRRYRRRNARGLPPLPPPEAPRA